MRHAARHWEVVPKLSRCAGLIKKRIGSRWLSGAKDDESLTSPLWCWCERPSWLWKGSREGAMELIERCRPRLSCRLLLLSSELTDSARGRPHDVKAKAVGGGEDMVMKTSLTSLTDQRVCLFLRFPVSSYFVTSGAAHLRLLS